MKVMNAESRRRGVLLLVVLSMLTLFLLLGTAYLVVSTRSRVTARAFNRLVMLSDEARVPVDQCLDSVLLHVVRGGTDAAIPSLAGTGPRPPAHFESLLEDMYGRSTTLTGTAQTVMGVSGTALGPVLTLTSVDLSFATTGTSPSPPFPRAAELTGRVLTLCPGDGAPTSHRILKATGTAPTFVLQVEAPSSSRPFRLPKQACRVVVNGREFDGQGTTNEAWDAFDDGNRFLAHIEPSGTSISASSMSRISYLGSGTTATITSGTLTGNVNAADKFDSDNDGEKDSLFLDFDLPSIPTSAGMLELDAAVLIVDLDSRFNVNAHGSLAGRLYPPGGGWPAVSGTSLGDVPLGSGYGPPEVNAAWMYPQDPAATQYVPASRQVTDTKTGATEDNAFAAMVGSGIDVTGRRPSGSRFTVSGSTPAFEPLQGRYGEAIRSSWTNFQFATATAGDPLPGQAVTDDLLSRITDQQSPPAQGQGTTWTVSGSNTAGVPSLWWSGTTVFDWEANRSRTSYNSPPDLHGRMKAVSIPPSGQGIAPRLAYAKVEWGDGETRDDPYELVLGPSAPRNGWMGDPNTNGTMPVYDNPFSIAELEAVLRPYDTDTFRLPMRLAAILGSVAEESRLRVTTASWDTTVITGSASANLASWIRNLTGTAVSGTSAIEGILGGEVARWEKFNLNRPLTSVKPAGSTYSATAPYYLQRQAYFKDLYTLLCALLHPTGTVPAAKAKEYAQWAANVVEFRDADSTMTPFEYDTNPSNGWDVDGNAQSATGDTDRDLVWGIERPEILIMETSAWEDASTGELFVTLHRPWNATALSVSGSIAGEPCDADLDVPGVPKNQVDLGRKDASSTYPIWRIRIDDGAGNAAFVRLDAVGAGATPDLCSSSITGPATTPKMGSDSWLCIFGQNSLNAQITASGTVAIDQGGTGSLRVPGTPNPIPGINRRATVYLERLTDPSMSVAGSTWTAASGTSLPHYHVVDQAPVEVVNRAPPPPPVPTPPPSVTRRDVTNASQSPWHRLPPNAPATPENPVRLGPASFAAGASNGVWFPWLNRPFISAAELFLVPWVPAAAITSGSAAADMLSHYQSPSPTSNSLLELHSGTNHLLLLEAVHAPTRFAGVHRTVTASTGALKQAGIFPETTPVNQLSSYREPGRVNLNTVTADDVWNAVVAGPLSQPGGATRLAAPLKSRSAGNGSAQPPAATGTAAPADFLTTAATSATDILTLQGTGTGTPTLSVGFTADTHQALVLSGSYNPAHLLYTANRLANTATIRSNVFAVWITLREQIQNDPDSIKYHRAFYIVDRSIPVGHEPGRNHNVWDAVLLRRIIE